MSIPIFLHGHERAHAHSCECTTYVSSIREEPDLYDLHTGHGSDA